MAEASQSQGAQPRTLEERLQPWFDQGEYLIILVIGLMAYAAGWVDLIGFQSPVNPTVFGRYSLPFFAVIIVYTLGFGVWFWFISSLSALDRLKRGVDFIQRHPVIYILIWCAFFGIIWSMFNVGYWTSLPLLEVAVLIMMVLFTVLVLFSNPTSRFQTWRKVALGLIGSLIVFELALQGLAALGVLPLSNTSGVTTPYGRVYQAEEGLGYGTTNQLGWYYPEFRLAADNRRIILSGDTFVAALQIPMDQHMGLRLEQLINSNDDTPSEVLAQGQVGYGASMFINPIMSGYLWDALEPDELIVVFHLANDFQIGDPATDPRPHFEVDETGTPVVLDEDFATWHYLAHLVIAGHDPPNPIRTVASNLFSVQALNSAAERFVGVTIERPDLPLPMEQASADQPFGLASELFASSVDPAHPSFELAAAQIRSFSAHMREQGVRVRMVTIPYFPPGFYAANAGNAWTAEWDQYDLLLPERILQTAASASEVDFLGMGQYLLATGMNADQVQALYFNNGSGHLTESGHALFAQAMYECFYASTGSAPNISGCQAGTTE